MKQLELDLEIKGTSEFDDVPDLQEMMRRKKERPENLEYLSEKRYGLTQELFKRRF